MKKKILIILFTFCQIYFLNGQVLDAGKNVIFSQDRKREVALDGEWRFLFSSTEGVGNEGTRKDCDDSQWDRIPVPGCWDALGYIEPRYTNPYKATGIYRRDFDVPAKWLRNGHVFLRFDGVLKGYEVWVNGEFAGKWESAFNSCHFDVTDYVVPGKNLLAVKVYTEYKGADFDSNDDWGQAGINRSISVFPVPDMHISDITVRTSNVSEQNAVFEYAVDVDNFTGKKKNASLRLKVKDSQGRTILRKKAKVTPGSNPFEGQVTISSPELWNAENPVLYTFECQVDRNDSQRLNFGVREVKVNGDQLELNGHPIKLRGVCLHDTDPHLGKFITRELLLKDLTMMKQANINFIRCSHYPKSPQFYDLCDSLGFYVMDEVPFGFGDSHLSDESYQDILLTRADATVSRDKNHPCVIIWSIGNENPLTPIAENTGMYVKSKDPTRPICYPMIHDYFLSLDYNIPEFVDIFAPHYPPVSTLLGYAANAKRPVIATEYCHSLGQSLEQMDELWEIMQANKNLAGGAIWEWCDQGMQDRNGKFPGRFAVTDKLWLKDSTCIMMQGNSGTDGILYADRTPLSNYYEVKTNYAQARLLTDSLKIKRGSNNVNLTLENRYDFQNFSDDINFCWTLKEGTHILDSGNFILNCEPGESANKEISLTAPDDPEKHIYSFSLQAISKRWGILSDYEIPVVSKNGMTGMDLFSLGNAQASEETPVIPEMFLRAGRKRGLAEQIRAKNSVSHYLIRPQLIAGGNVVFKNDEFSAKGKIEISHMDNSAIHIDAEITPKVENVMLLEGGLAFLLGPDVNYVQWIGNGPYSSYPGKMRANHYGVHSIHSEDIYFDGNRIGVDAVLATDAEGQGWLFLCKGSGVNFEYTDAGTIISINDKVSGLCGKLRPTSFPIMTSADDPIKVSLVMIPLTPGQWPQEVSNLFKQTSEIKAYNPFLTQYDTYCLRLTDILGEQ